MEKDKIVLDHLPLLSASNIVDGERIQKLSQGVDRIYRLMNRRRKAFKRCSKVRKIFNI